MSEVDFATVSPFIQAGPLTTPDTLALLPHRRDLIQATVLSGDKDAVCNTRFGNYPHKTLLHLPWGSQVLASKLVQDNQRRPNKKRKLNDAEPIQADDDGLVIIGTASSGFTHVLPPTPELWSQSLPHRTQVVYTPDYSYVLHRLRVRPGSVVIEAGAGSGSFTHAAARAVFNGVWPKLGAATETVAQGKRAQPRSSRSQGRVFSFEYHEPRAKELSTEIDTHRLTGTVTVTHRDVYEDGFNIIPRDASEQDPTAVSPEATAVFLDLPAPWLALKHLRRKRKTNSESMAQVDAEMTAKNPPNDFLSPLSPDQCVHLCAFSPCIEQVSKTMSTLRELGWTDVDMVELAHRRIDVRRTRYGMHEAGSRDGISIPATVEEAVAHLRGVKAVEERNRALMKEREAQIVKELGISNGEGKDEVARRLKAKARDSQVGNALQQHRSDPTNGEPETKAARLSEEGFNVVMRTEPELRCHTSYLVFASLPREWTAQDEDMARQRVEALSNKKRKQ